MAASGEAAGAVIAAATISELRAEADALRERIRLLQDKVMLSCGASHCDGSASGDALPSLTAASVHASAAESALREMVGALTTTAPAASHGPQHTNDAGSSAAAAAAANGGGGDGGGEMDVDDASPEEPIAQAAVADSDLSAAAPPQPRYRITSRSGQQPPNQPPARLRLSADELASVFAFTHPWELTRRRRILGKTIFTEAAANYTHLTIDASKKGGVRRLWERMPLRTAYKWGQRATNITHLHAILPREYAALGTVRCW
ncbi:unnamed protein product [Vitrella brassicaformis CCMP3155]|uniref:Uncharacterized protein n=1 Tax=Vitrella brassicaformis (strain CCMP3155) TaxID=1169540 RepID=A0A0G4EJ59_VITBC|nr:unnamed protein product [Vitrella brassicaformis CCMP3155]|eukprot:CEL95945.1 unnamed protein product [Vitrella brassicaformis CCMP3155]